jgi:hypothetical protein
VTLHPADSVHVAGDRDDADPHVGPMVPLTPTHYPSSARF